MEPQKGAYKEVSTGKFGGSGLSAGQWKKSVRKWKIAAVIFILLSLALLIAVIVLAVKHTETIHNNKHDDDNCDDISAPPAAQEMKDKRGNQVFRGLSSEETEEIIQYMIADPDLNIQPSSNASLNTNYIYSVEDYLPDKIQVLEYLDGGPSEQPTRKARVIVFNGASTPKQVHEYLVWPIPKPNTKSRAYLNRPDNKELTWKSRPICNHVEMPAIGKFLVRELTPLKSMMNESFGQWLAPDCKATECIYMNAAPRSIPTLDDRHIILWAFLNQETVEDYYLYPLDFYILLTTPNNGDQYQIKKIYYNKKSYGSVMELKDIYNRNPDIRMKPINMKDRQGTYGSPRYSKNGETMDQSRRPPVQYSPDGRRYTVDGMHVTYLEWSFDIHLRTVTGLQLFDVRFAGERIAYEISMQDILVLYSGAEPDNYFKNYFDNGWGIGRFNLPLIRGVDCPMDAYYMDTTSYDLGADKTLKLKDGICIFEHRNSVPMRHHYSNDFFRGNYRFAFSMPDTVLIVRQVLTVWNYDYIYDYEFHQNGMVEAKVSSTGYIAASTNIESAKYGYIVEPDTGATANLHQHVFNFKFDMDVGGIKNRFKTLDIGYEQINNPYVSQQKWSQMTITENLIGNEAQARMRYNFDDPKYYVFYNFFKDTNGHNRGYRLLANGFSKVVLPDQHPFMRKGAAWAKNQITVTKQNEKERTTASHFVQGDPYDPAIDFNSFSADNENLLDQDLVAWVTVGLHHIPSFEDLPVTTTPGKTVSVALAPFNYFDRDPSIHSRDATVMWDSKWNPANDYLDIEGSCVPKYRNPFLM